MKRVIIVPGFGSKRHEWRFSVIPGRLRECGYEVEIFRNYDDGKCDIDANAEKLTNQLFKSNHLYSHSFAIGHSMGGLVIRQSLRHNNDLLDGVVTLATPHQGTYSANLAALAGPLAHHSVHQMAAGSSFIKELPELPIWINAMSIEAALDQIVWPSHFSKWQGQQHRRVLASHSSLLFMPRVANIILDFFEGEIN